MWSSWGGAGRSFGLHQRTDSEKVAWHGTRHARQLRRALSFAEPQTPESARQQREAAHTLAVAKGPARQVQRM